MSPFRFRYGGTLELTGNSYGDMEIWRCRDIEKRRCGDMEIWRNALMQKRDIEIQRYRKTKTPNMQNMRCGETTNHIWRT